MLWSRFRAVPRHCFRLYRVQDRTYQYGGRQNRIATYFKVSVCRLRAKVDTATAFLKRPKAAQPNRGRTARKESGSKVCEYTRILLACHLTLVFRQVPRSRKEDETNLQRKGIENRGRRKTSERHRGGRVQQGQRDQGTCFCCCR